MSKWNSYIPVCKLMATVVLLAGCGAAATPAAPAAPAATEAPIVNSEVPIPKPAQPEVEAPAQEQPTSEIASNQATPKSSSEVSDLPTSAWVQEQVLSWAASEKRVLGGRVGAADVRGIKEGTVAILEFEDFTYLDDSGQEKSFTGRGVAVLFTNADGKWQIGGITNHRDGASDNFLFMPTETKSEASSASASSDTAAQSSRGLPTVEALRAAVLSCLETDTGNIALTRYRKVPDGNDIVAEISFEKTTWYSSIYERSVTFSGEGFAQFDVYLDGRLRLHTTGLSAIGIEQPAFKSCSVVIGE